MKRKEKRLSIFLTIYLFACMGTSAVLAEKMPLTIPDGLIERNKKNNILFDQEEQQEIKDNGEASIVIEEFDEPSKADESIKEEPIKREKETIGSEIEVVHVEEARPIQREKNKEETIETEIVPEDDAPKTREWYVAAQRIDELSDMQDFIDNAEYNLAGEWYASDDTHWVFLHSNKGGTDWYNIKEGDVVNVNDKTYNVIYSGIAIEKVSGDYCELYLNDKNIWTNSGYPLVMKTCYDGEKNWVIVGE